MNEWRMLRDIRKGDVCDDGSVITSDPVDCPDTPGYAVYTVRDTDGVTHTDYWAWDEELRMMTPEEVDEYFGVDVEYYMDEDD